MRRLTEALAALVLLAVAAVAGAIAFDAPRYPAASPGLASPPASAQWKAAEMPAAQRLAARDGAPLAYRAYLGKPDQIVVLIHGSTGTSLDMHRLAQALQAAGATVYSLSLRGHGGSGTAYGDVSYIGQLDDDLADFMKGLGLDKPGQRRTLIGFSVGGGFALRTASGRMQRAFDKYIAIAPYVADYAALGRRSIGGWAFPATLRIAGLYLLEELGIERFQDLTAVRYAVDPKPDDQHTPAYTYRMLRSLHMGFHTSREIGRIEAPTVILTSDKDQLAGLQASGNPHLRLRQIQGVDHADMVLDPRALSEIVSIWRDLNSR